MKQNEGPMDRNLRMAAGVLLIAVAVFGLTGVTQTVVLVLAGVLLFTGLTGFCAIYKLLGIDTLPKKN